MEVLIVVITNKCTITVTTVSITTVSLYITHTSNFSTFQCHRQALPYLQLAKLRKFFNCSC